MIFALDGKKILHDILILNGSNCASVKVILIGASAKCMVREKAMTITSEK